MFYAFVMVGEGRPSTSFYERDGSKLVDPPPSRRMTIIKPKVICDSPACKGEGEGEGKCHRANFLNSSTSPNLPMNRSPLEPTIRTRIASTLFLDAGG